MRAAHDTDGMSIDVTAGQDRLSARVAAEIRVAMVRRGMSGAALAKELGVSAAWVSYRLTGTQEIGLDDLQRIARALRVSIIDLISHAEKGDGSYVSVGSRAVQVTQLTPEFSRIAGHEALISGTSEHPGHPVVAGAVKLPIGRPFGPRKTAPTGR